MTNGTGDTKLAKAMTPIIVCWVLGGAGIGE